MAQQVGLVAQQVVLAVPQVVRLALPGVRLGPRARRLARQAALLAVPPVEPVLLQVEQQARLAARLQAPREPRVTP